AQGQARDAGIRGGAPGGGEAERLGLAVELAPRDSTLSAHGAPDGIDPNTLHQGQVDHQPAVADAGAREAVGAAAYGHEQRVVTGEVDGAEGVGHPDGAADQAWPPLDIGVPNLAGLGIARIVGSDELAAQALLELFNGGCRERGLPASKRARL